jgi:hypothetical protein
MFGQLGNLRVRTRSARRLELALTRTTHVVGWSAAIAGIAAAITVARWSTWAAIVPLTLGLLGLVVATMRQHLVFDRDDGVLRIEHRVAGIPSHSVVPLFHLKLVVVRARPRGDFIAVVERRIGEPIVLDTGDAPGPLYALAQAVAEVAQLRLVYDATTAVN